MIRKKLTYYKAGDVIYLEGVREQQALFKQFQDAVNMLDELAVVDFQKASESEHHQRLKEVMQDIPKYIGCNDELRDKFINATCAVIFNMIPSFEHIGEEDTETANTVFEAAKTEIMDRFIKIAIKADKINEGLSWGHIRAANLA